MGWVHFCLQEAQIQFLAPQGSWSTSQSNSPQTPTPALMDVDSNKVDSFSLCKRHTPEKKKRSLIAEIATAQEVAERFVHTPLATPMIGNEPFPLQKSRRNPELH